RRLLRLARPRSGPTSAARSCPGCTPHLRSRTASRWIETEPKSVTAERQEPSVEPDASQTPTGLEGRYVDEFRKSQTCRRRGTHGAYNNPRRIGASGTDRFSRGISSHPRSS